MNNTSSATATELLNKGRSLDKLGRYEEAIEYYDKVIEIDPNNVDVWDDKIGALKKLGRTEEANKCYQEFIKSIPNRWFGKLFQNFEQLDDDNNIRREIDNLFYNFDKFYKAGRIDEALRIAVQIPEKIRKEIGENRLEYAESLLPLAFLYEKLEDYSKAEPIALKILDIRRYNLGENNPEYAISLNNLGVLYYKMGQYSKAQPLYEKALEIQRATLPEDDPNIAQTLNNLAMLYTHMGQYSKAEPFLLKALDIIHVKFGENRIEYIDKLSNLALLYRDLGQYSKAQSFLEKALELRRNVFNEFHPDIAQNLNDLAVLYGDMGQYSKAQSFLEKALELRRNVLGENHPVYANSLDALARLYRDIGDIPKAIRLYQKALEIKRNILGDNNLDYSHSLNDLAQLYYDRHQYSEAEPLYQKALEIRLNILGENHPDVAQIMNSLAMLYRAIHRYVEAESLYERAKEIIRSRLSENHPYYLFLMNNLAFLYMRRGQYSKAQPLYEKALELRRNVLGENHPDVAQTMNNLAGLYASIGRPVESLDLLKKSAAIYDSMIAQVFSTNSDVTRMNFLERIRNLPDMFLSLVNEHFTQSQHDIQAAMEIVLRRKGLAAEALAVQRDAILSGKYPEYKPKLQEMKNLRMKISQTILAGPTVNESWVSVKQEIEQLYNRQEMLEAELARNIPEISLENKLSSIDLKTVANNLPNGTVLIEFIRTHIFDFTAVESKGEKILKPDHYMAFVLPSQKPEDVHMIDIGEAEHIDKMISNFITSITGEEQAKRNLISLSTNQRNTENIKKSIKLRKAIFDPLLAFLGDSKRLLIATDGDITRLPFEVLPIDDDSNHRLIDNYNMTYLNSGRDCMRFRTAAATEQSTPALVAGDPDFDFSGTGIIIDDDNRQYFQSLPGTREETKFIAQMLNVSPILGQDVIETRIKSTSSPFILHLATHGFFLPSQGQIDDKADQSTVTSNTVYSIQDRLSERKLADNPLLRSGLALAGANTWLRRGTLPEKAEDGILTAEDVSGMDLSNTEVVVLSACQTALGDVIVGEGVFGLQRAFVLAGAQTLVMSLWTVPDEQTKELMVDFYNRLLAGKARSEALREAQLAMKEKYPNPYYWGAFVCQGNPAPLSNPNFASNS